MSRDPETVLRELAKRDAVAVLREAVRGLPNEIYVQAYAAVDDLDALVRAVASKKGREIRIALQRVRGAE